MMSLPQMEGDGILQHVPNVLRVWLLPTPRNSVEMAFMRWLDLSKKNKPNKCLKGSGNSFHAWSNHGQNG